jgi:uncharacterized membrane protein HdeD (DUF308 family)
VATHDAVLSEVEIMSLRDEKVRQVAAGVQHRVSSKLGDIWWAFMLRGLLALGLAACALFWPQQTVGLLIKLLGAYFIIDGLAGAIGAFRAESKGSHLMQAIISLAGGLVLLFWTGISAKLFLMAVGVWALLQGISIFVTSRSIDPDEEGRGLMGTIGAILAVVGLVFIVWPKTGAVAISWLIAAAAIVVGGLLVYLATRLKRVRGRIDTIGT